MNIRKQFNNGFTIVELLVVIAIIGILATITVVSYSTIQASAHDSSVLSSIDSMNSLQSSYRLRNGGVGKPYYSDSGYDNDLGFKPVNGDVIDVMADATGYCIRGYNERGTKNSINNAYTEESAIGVCDSLGISKAAMKCPSNFIVVPPSITYGTSTFCVMKYEAKNAGGNVPVSQVSGLPWGNVSQSNATTYSSRVVGCVGCHIITEAEWLTIAQNVLKVPSNWSSGVVGSGYIYSGHTDNAPSASLAADADDNNGYSGETNVGGNQRRTLTLTNGEVIWDFAGNLSEYTSGQTSGGQPGISGGGSVFRDWSVVTTHGTLSPDPFPITTGIAGASSWNGSNGIGKIRSDCDSSTLVAFIRGGGFQSNMFSATDAGVLMLALSPSGEYTNIGFRVSR